MLHPTHAILDLQNGKRLDRRTINLGYVALLHVVIVWVIARAIVPMDIPVNPGSLELHNYNTPQSENSAPLPPFKQVDPKPVIVQAPTFTVKPDSTGSGGITAQSPAPPVSKPAPDSGPMAANARTIPPYPPQAARMGREGTVTLKLLISDTGNVSAAEIVSSSGYTDLDQAAASWVQDHWKYKPALRAGQPVAGSTQVSVTFSLQNGR